MKLWLAIVLLGAAHPKDATDAGAKDAHVTSKASTMQGHVVDAKGKPIAGAKIAAYPPGLAEASADPEIGTANADLVPLGTATTNNEGAFTLDVPSGEVELRVTAKGEAPSYVKARAPSASVRVTLRPPSVDD